MVKIFKNIIMHISSQDMMKMLRKIWRLSIPISLSISLQCSMLRYLKSPRQEKGGLGIFHSNIMMNIFTICEGEIFKMPETQKGS